MQQSNIDIPLPQAFLERMSGQLGNEFPMYMEAMEQPPLRGIRLNSLKKCSFPVTHLEEIPWWDGGFYLQADSLAGSLPVHDAGAYYIQEPSAMLPVAVLDPKPGERILDLCAAPGGKSTQIGERLRGKGLLVANEPVQKRAQVLSRNIERIGVTNSIVTSAYPGQLSSRWQEMFDAILVDAPCSGEGMFRKNSEARQEWTSENASGCAVRQLEILDEAAKMLKPGGRMVYSTCTLNIEENQYNVLKFLKKHSEFQLKHFDVGGIEAADGFYTFYPHKNKGEGHFAALMMRSGTMDESRKLSSGLRKPTKQEMAAFGSFSSGKIAPNAVFKENLVHIDEEIDLTGIPILRVGLHMGSVKGKIFTPDHSWAVSSCPPEIQEVTLTQAEAEKYQQGETIPVDTSKKGYVLAEYYGIPLGFGKISDGVMKNHYPKGLRK